MIATVHPVGREPFDVTLTGYPRYTDLARGGYDSADIPCTLEPWMLDRLLDARVTLSDATGQVWAGWVWQYGTDGLSCAGHHSRLGLLTRRAMYASTDFISDLVRWEGTNGGSFMGSTANGVVGLWQSPGSEADSGDGAGFYYWGDVPLVQLTYGVTINHADVSLAIYTSATKGAASSSVATNTSTATGQTATLSGAYGFVIKLNCDVNDSLPSKDDKKLTLANLALYGVTGVTSTTPGNIILDSLAELPATDQPAGSAYTARIATDEATALVPFDVTGSEADVINEVCDRTGRDFAFRLRDVGGIEWPVPVYRARPTVPAYYCHHDGINVRADIIGGSMADMRSKVVYTYRDVDNNDRFGTVTDTDASHYLVKIGRTYAEELGVDTTDATAAASAATAYLAAKSAVTHAGRILVDGPHVTTPDGAPIAPSRIEAGNVITVTGTPFGDVTGYITAANHDGESSVEIVIDDERTIPASIRALIR